jgi:hypothetical protein
MKNIEGVKLKKFTYQVLKSFKQDYTDLENFRDAELVLEDTITLDCSGYHNPLEVFWAWRIREARNLNKKNQYTTLYSYIVTLKGEEE